MTGLEQLQEFLATPRMSDIISFSLLIVLFIMQTFVKRFVRRDNLQTLFSVERKTDNVDKLRRDFEQSLRDNQNEREQLNAELRAERELYEREKQKLEAETAAVKAELNNIKRVIRLGFGNVDGLVKSGTANKLAKMLPVDSEPTGKEENITEVKS